MSRLPGILLCATSTLLGCQRSSPSVPDVPDAPSDAPLDAGDCAPRTVIVTPPEPNDFATIAGYVWDGTRCHLRTFHTIFRLGSPVFPPTTCADASCATEIFTDQETCVAAFAACGARVERPPVGAVFERAPEAGILCGAQGPCALGMECLHGVVDTCAAPDPSSYPARTRCDDQRDCADATCCVDGTALGAYVRSRCAAACAASTEARACANAAECGAGEHCCTMQTPYPPGLSDPVGVCTATPCTP